MELRKLTFIVFSDNLPDLVTNVEAFKESLQNDADTFYLYSKFYLCAQTAEGISNPLLSQLFHCLYKNFNSETSVDSYWGTNVVPSGSQTDTAQAH